MSNCDLLSWILIVQCRQFIWGPWEPKVTTYSDDKTPPGEFDQNPSKNHSIVIMKPPYLIYDGWLDKLVKQMALTVADITTFT